MNILVVRTDKLGDFITALPAIYILKKYSPHNKIIACVAPLNKELAEACEFIDEVIIDTPQSPLLELVQKIKKHKIDASISFFSNTRIALAQFLAQIKIRIAPATKIAQIFYNRRVKQRRSRVEMAEFEYNIALIKVLFSDIKEHYPQPLLTFDDAKDIYRNFCKKHAIEKEVIAFHVGFGGSSDANWTLDEYEVLIGEVVKNKKYQVLLTFGPDEEALYQEMQRRFQNTSVVLYISEDGLIHFAKLIANCKLFISTSTGTYHLASLVGCATMTFFADSLFASAARWKSVGDEKLQHHFMLPSDAKKRAEVFEQVKDALATL